MNSILLRIQNALVEATKPSRMSSEAGGFMIMLTPKDPLVWINYAVPTSDSTPEGVDEMVKVFRDAERTPRLEFSPDLWPETVNLLEERGFLCEKRMPIMILKREQWKGLSSDHDIKEVNAETYYEVNRMLGEAFGMPPSETQCDANPLDDPSFQRIFTRATLAVAAQSERQVVGAGFAVGTKEIREIAGIGTRKEYRRRGIASAVIARLLDDFFAEGGEVAWLAPGDDTAQSVYANLGFQAIAEQVVYALE